MDMEGGVKRREKVKTKESRIFDFGKKPARIKKVDKKQGVDVTSLQYALTSLFHDGKYSDERDDSLNVVGKMHESSQSSEEPFDPIYEKMRKKSIKKQKQATTVVTRPPSKRAAAAAAKKTFEKIKELAKSVGAPKQKLVKTSVPVKKLISGKRQPIKPGPYDVIKRSYSQSFKFSDEYIRDFYSLLNRIIPGLVQAIRSENNEITDAELSKIILKLHDSVYFELRDELLVSLGLQKRELDTMME